MFQEMGWEGLFPSCPGLPPCPTPHHVALPLKQAAELENVSGSQDPQHVVHVHLHLAHVEVLQGRGEGWEGSIRESRQQGALQPGSLTPRRPLLGAACPPAGRAEMPSRENAPALTWAQTPPTPHLGSSPKELRIKPKKTDLLLKACSCRPA